MARRDERTVDLFSAQPATTGSLSCSIEIAHTMSEALERCRERGADRQRIADRMSYLGGETVSLAMLNAYTSASRETHKINLERAITFDASVSEVIDEKPLSRLHAARVGDQVVSPEEASLIELGRIHQQERELAERKRALQVLLRSSPTKR